MRRRTVTRLLLSAPAMLATLLLPLGQAAAQTILQSLLILEKSDNTLAFVDPATLQVLTRVPSGTDPHEIVASPDGKLAYISNYGGLDSFLNTISVVDIAAHRTLPPIVLGALRSPHGLYFAGGELYFTAETNKAIGRYDPGAQTVDWVLGTGQDRTHMVLVSSTLDRIFTSNVSSGTISFIEQVEMPAPPGPPPGGGAAGNNFSTGAAPPPGLGQSTGLPRKTWRVTNVSTGRGAEGFDVSPDGKELWAANAQDGTVTVIDVAGKTPLATVPISIKGANRLKFTPDGKRVLVSGLGGDTSINLVILDAASRKEIKTFDLGGGAAGILVVPDGSRAFVAVSAKDRVVSVDLKTLQLTGTIATGKQPDGLAWVQGK